MIAPPVANEAGVERDRAAADEARGGVVAARLALITKPRADLGAEDLLLPHLRRHLVSPVSSELVDVAATVPISKRTIYRACREGTIEGAVQRGRRWLATRAAVDRWLAAGLPRLVPASEEGDDDLEAIHRSLLSNGRRSPARPR